MHRRPTPAPWIPRVSLARSQVPPSSPPVLKNPITFQRYTAANQGSWDRRVAGNAQIEHRATYAEAPSSSSQSAASGHAVMQQQQSSAQRHPGQQAPRSAPQQVAAQAQSRPTPKPPKPVSTKEWRKMNVFQREEYQKRGGVEPTTVSVGKVRSNVFDSKKNSKKDGWF